jgi:translation initiation factor IF-3
MVGVVETIVALRRAYEAGLDLVEVAPDSTPPVCRILDFGKYKYELAKKDKATKAKSKAAELKEVRLGRSMKIDPHDVAIRLNQAKKFLIDGHKVQIVQNFRGREMMHKDRGDQRMKEIIEELSELGKVEIPPRMAGRRMTMIMAPDKAKVDAYKRKQAKAKAEGDGQGKTAPSPLAPEDAKPEPMEKSEATKAAPGADAKAPDAPKARPRKSEAVESSKR